MSSKNSFYFLSKCFFEQFNLRKFNFAKWNPITAKQKACSINIISILPKLHSYRRYQFRIKINSAWNAFWSISLNFENTKDKIAFLYIERTSLFIICQNFLFYVKHITQTSPNKNMKYFKSLTLQTNISFWFAICVFILFSFIWFNP